MPVFVSKLCVKHPEISLVIGLLQGCHGMQVGDVLQIVKDSFFPADLLLLAVPESPDGLAYVETINLDGESNLKIKKALDQTQHIRVDTMQDFMVTFWLPVQVQQAER